MFVCEYGCQQGAVSRPRDFAPRLNKDFVMPIRANRKVALSAADKRHGRYVCVDTLALEPGTLQEIYPGGVDFPLNLVKQVFVYEDGGVGLHYLVTSDTALYRNRWHVEPYQKSPRQNTTLEKSPTHTVTTQTNRLFAALCGYITLELLRSSVQLNHFALKAKLYHQALQTVSRALQQLQPVQLAA
jgi:hypothetical protein